jgi:hypothetical protein
MEQTITIHETKDSAPEVGCFYLAFDLHWFTAYLSSSGVWRYHGKPIFPTHYAELPNNPIKPKQ